MKKSDIDKFPLKQVDPRAVDADGKLMKIDGEVINSTIREALADPETNIVLIIAINRDGDLVMPVLGPPSLQTLSMLKAATNAYECALESIKRERES